MADADKQAGTSVEGAGVTLIVLVALGCLYFSHREPRLLSSLAAMTEVSIIAPAAAQKVDVRSWEDPFAAVARSLDKFGKDELAKCPTPTTAAAIASDRSVCNSPLMNLNKETLVIGVTMSGAPYAEDAERRRRTRYAVLAGLDQAEFMPKDARHLGYFLWTQPDIEHTVVPVPYQWFEKAPSQNQAATFQRILVLWLDEDAFNDHPLQKLSALKQFVFNNNEESDDENLNIIGPYSSDTLRDMVGEIEQQCVTASSHEKCKNADYFNLKNVHFYAYGASASDHWLLQNSMDNFSSVQSFFEYFDIHLQRTTSTDDTLARGIVRELQLRHVWPGERLDDLALISERDTFYGQTLPKSVARGFAAAIGVECREDFDCPWIHKLTYLRGLDGQLPSAERTEGGKQTNVSKSQTDAKGLDRPMGQGQFDYLRRMSEQLHQIDDDLRKRRGRIAAVGILGSDVFDKLLLLRALRQEFPEALFFTTDFDEAYTIKGEVPWTRNLVISSSFGPNLHAKYQGGVPAFRDSYQTSAFLATQLAIGDQWQKAPHLPHISQGQLAQELSVSRLFEIERSGGILLVAGPPPPQDNRVLQGTLPDARIQPEIGGLFPRLAASSEKALAQLLAGLGILVLALLFIPKVRKAGCVEVGILFWSLVVSAMAVANWNRFAEYLTERGNGEPMVMLQGVSVWPTVLLRILGIILAFYLIWRVQISLHENLAEIADEMGLNLPGKRTLSNRIASVFKDKRPFLDKIASAFLSMPKNIVRAFDFSLGGDPVEPKLLLNVKVVWEAYIDHEKFWRRYIRTFCYVIMTFMISSLIIIPLVGNTTLFSRGELVRFVYLYISIVDIFLMQFLNYYVLDATLFCLLFVTE